MGSVFLHDRVCNIAFWCICVYYHLLEAEVSKSDFLAKKLHRLTLRKFDGVKPDKLTGQAVQAVLPLLSI